MEGYGIAKGLVWQASSRYNNKVMTEDEVDAFYDRAAMGGPPPEGVVSRRHRKSWDVSVHMPDKHPSTSTTASPAPAEQRLLLPDSSAQDPPSGNPSNKTPARQFVFGSGSTSNYSVSQFSFQTKCPGDVHENTFCRSCQNVIAKARGIRMKPKEGARGGLSVYVEGGCSDDEADDPRYCDAFPMHYKNYVELQQSALNGCHLCSLIAAPDPNAGRNPPIGCQNQYMLGVYGEQSYDGPGRIEMQVLQYERKVIDLSYDCPNSRLQGSLRYKRTDTDDVFTLAQGWLGQCRLYHKDCRHRSDLDDFMPTRLLKVTASARSLLSVKLCITKDDGFRNTPYLALSHCWGGAKVTKLEMKTLDSFQRDIPLGSLPQNFTDSALITARLGFTYLWIDSLCIIQDSKADCAREIPTMGGVYGRAVLTIAALGAENSGGGCFVTRNPLALVPALLRDGDKDTRDQVWAWNQRLRDPNAEGRLRPPLHRRAWVVQERALAPRTLYFGSDIVYWECVEDAASEASPGISRERTRFWEPDSSTAHSVGLKTALHIIRHKAARGGGWEDWQGFWWKLVREYTASKLSFNRDKWAAISALAMQVEKDTGSRLYHGLWECNIFDEILWKCLQPGQRIDPADLDAPSWSWLSVVGAVHEQRFNYSHDFKKEAMVEKPVSARTSADGLGRSDKLLVRGCLRRMSWSAAYDSRGRDCYSFRFRDNHDGVFGAGKSNCKWYPDITLDKIWDLSILPLVTSKSGNLESYGLVVRPSDASKMSWLRVGFYRLDYIKKTKEDTWSDFIREKETITLV
jgi:hypothetical protein